MKVAIYSAQKFERRFFGAANKTYSHQLTYFQETLHAGTALAAEGFDAVCAFVNDKLTEETLAILTKGGTRLIALRSAGYNNVDLSAAKKLNLTVMRVSAYSPSSVAEHAVALMMTLNRGTHRAYNRVREGNFDLNGLVGFGMAGKSVGIVGTGKIGCALARILAGFGCKLLGFDVAENPACISLGMRYCDLPELLGQADIISLHCPLTENTRHLINEKTLALMKPGAMLINTARGAILDTKAVIRALKRKDRLAYLGIDVYEEEGPLFFEDRSSTIIEDDVFERLTTFPNVLITAHQAFLTREALTEIANVTLGNISAYEAGSPNPNNIVSA